MFGITCEITGDQHMRSIIWLDQYSGEPDIYQFSFRSCTVIASHSAWNPIRQAIKLAVA